MAKWLDALEIQHFEAIEVVENRLELTAQGDAGGLVRCEPREPREAAHVIERKLHLHVESLASLVFSGEQSIQSRRTATVPSGLKECPVRATWRILLSVAVRVVVCVVVVAAGFTVAGALIRTAPSVKEVEAEQDVPSVLVMRARAVDVERQWSGYGTARPMDAVDVPARVSATVVSIPAVIEPGAPVERDDLLTQLDPTDFDRQVEISTENLADVESQIERLDVEEKSLAERARLADELVDLARADFDRVQDVFNRNAANQNELDRARNTMLQAMRDQVLTNEELEKLGPRRASLKAQRAAFEAQLRIARQNQERSTIRSPLEGIIEAVDVEVGENLTTGQRVARVVSLRRIEVPIRLPASARSTLRGGERTRLSATGMIEQSWDGRIVRIAPADDENTRTMIVYVEIDQDAADPQRIVPGKFLRGDVRVAASSSRWVVPRQAIKQDRLHLVRDGIVRSIPVRSDYAIEQSFPEFGIDERQWVVLRDPLPDDAMVVVTPTKVVVDGARVNATTAGATVRSGEAP